MTRTDAALKSTTITLSVFFILLWSYSIAQLSQIGQPSRVFPQSERVFQNDNLLLMTFRADEKSSPDLVVYTPWDTLSSLDLSTGPLRRAVGEKIARGLPENLILGNVSVQYALYHQPLMTVTDSFAFGTRMIGRNLFTQDTSLPVMRALIGRDASVASIRIAGWVPVVTPLNASRCRGVYIMVPVTLRPGLNVVRYGWLVQSGSSLLPPLDSISVFYSIDLDGKAIPAGYSTGIFHQSDTESRCNKCHAVASGSDSKITDQQTCLTCHGGMTKERSVHGPVASKDCQKCHDANPKSGFAVVYQPKDENQACFGCHTDVLNNTKEKAVVHGPFGTGGCNYCHSPHGSPNIYQLRKRVNDVCNSCHENKHEDNHPVVFHPVAGKPDPRNPDRELSCISCHDPHASDNKNLLAVADGYFALCQGCHRK